MPAYYDDLETRSADQRAADLARDLPAVIGHALEKAPAMADHLAGVNPSDVRDLAALAKLPVLRKSELAAKQAEHPPFGGFAAVTPTGIRHVFQSPGPLYEPGGAGAASSSPRASARATWFRTASPITSPPRA